LSGPPYTLTQAFDTVNEYLYQTGLPVIDYQVAGFYFSTITVVINGITRVFDVDGTDATFSIINTVGHDFGLDEVAAEQWGGTASHNAHARQYISSQTNDFLSSSNLDQSSAIMIGSDVDSLAEFQVFHFDTEFYTNSTSNVETAVLNAAVAVGVPEPGSLALLGAGLLGLAGLRRARGSGSAAA